MNASLRTRRAMLALALALAPITIASMSAAQAQPASSDAIVGKWEADDGSVKLDLFRAGSKFQARLLYGNKIVEADNVTLKKDLNNPDPALRSRSLKNIVFVTGLRWADGEWTGGSIYDASSGRTYNCRAEMQDGKLHVRGYLGVPALGQTQTFHRMP
ncbi:DUF2147 domain-containing protein [Methylobacterium symbioticum]|uniref:DUF2147 domain-containing protein n=1 Tax=Methylobacterium symbioticum TaxID=2584084 RepID=A0A509E810_9HYPH|nr:DUF2147 domain-containing protein [Methylobacterium symbioticum]VUD69725.1 hypothetical protein MET9862_00282 [Methylobacterium symbioticum]